MPEKPPIRRLVFLGTLLPLLLARAAGEFVVTHPFQGITYIVRQESTPRPVTMRIVLVDLTAPGIRFRVSPPRGKLETIRQTTLGFLKESQAQVAINAHFYFPYTTPEPDANVVGFAASDGRIYSPFEPQPIAPGYPDQSYAILPFAPALNIDPSNRANIVHRDPAIADNRHVLEPVTVWNAVAGSAQIITRGIPTVPYYSGPPDGLNPINGYSNSFSWYLFPRARTAIGIADEGRTLVMFTVDQGLDSGGLSVPEVATILIRDYRVKDALNLDGGPSTTLALQDPANGERRVVNASGDTGYGGGIGSSLAVFASLQIDPAMNVSIRTTKAGRAILSWPAADAAWHLEEASTLPPMDWKPSAIGNDATRTGDRIELTLLPQAGTRLYRLSRPAQPLP